MNIPELKRRRVIHLLPNLITSASIFFAFLAIIFSMNFTERHMSLAAMLIFLSAIMDGLDGKVARLTGTTSEFGVQLDSLADSIAFGVAPAIIVFNWQLNQFGRLGIAVAFVFMICTILRLARFNVNVNTTSKKFFVGLPSPAGGCTLTSFVLFAQLLPESWQFIIAPFCLVLTGLVAFLMVSTVRYYAFKELSFMQTRPFRSLLVVILIFVLLFTSPSIFLFILAAAYILSGLVYTYIYLPKRHVRIFNFFKK